MIPWYYGLLAVICAYIAGDAVTTARYADYFEKNTGNSTHDEDVAQQLQNEEDLMRGRLQRMLHEHNDRQARGMSAGRMN